MFVIRAVAPGPDGKRDFRWLVERTASCLTPSARGIQCVSESDGRIVGMLAYDQWTENACIAHVAVETPAAWRRMVHPAFEYPFIEAGKGLVLAGVSSMNTKSLQLMDRLGFRKTHTIKDAISVGVHSVLFEMRREECRWLRRR